MLQTIPASGSLALIYAGRAIAGFGVGGVSSIAPGFVAECSPANARGRITGLFQVGLTFLSFKHTHTFTSL